MNEQEFLCIDNAIKKEKHTFHFLCPFCNEEILVFEADFEEGKIQCPICDMTITLLGHNKNSMKTNLKAEAFQTFENTSSAINICSNNNSVQKKSSVHKNNHSYGSRDNRKERTQKCWRCKGTGQIQCYQGKEKHICHICDGKGFISSSKKEKNNSNYTSGKTSSNSPIFSSGCMTWTIVLVVVIFLGLVLHACESNQKKSIYDIPRDKPISPNQFTPQEWSLIIKRAMEESPEYQYYKKRGY